MVAPADFVIVIGGALAAVDGVHGQDAVCAKGIVDIAGVGIQAHPGAILADFAPVVLGEIRKKKLGFFSSGATVVPQLGHAPLTTGVVSGFGLFSVKMPLRIAKMRALLLQRTPCNGKLLTQHLLGGSGNVFGGETEFLE